eukprot:Skav204992  [mRNA]  locus=scaffold1180:854690:859121:- [translate_table: standard]
MSSRKQQLASAAAAVAVAVPGAANAMVDYDRLGGDQGGRAYRQFPGMFPTIAGLIGTHGPYKQVSDTWHLLVGVQGWGDIYNIPGMDDKLKSIAKKFLGIAGLPLCRSSVLGLAADRPDGE